MIHANKWGFMTIRIVSFVLIMFLGSILNAQIPEYIKYVDEVVKSFALQMQKELNLECIGDGGRMPHDVEKIEIDFDVKRRASIEEARKLQIFVATRFLQAINAHEKLRPFLHEYPFSLARIHLSIGFVNEFDQGFADGTVSSTFLCNGIIHYRSYNPIEEKLVNFHQEPYQEALKIIADTPLTADLLRQHTPTAYENETDQLLNEFAREVKKKWGLYCARQGGKLANGIEELAIKFVTDKRTSLPKARRLYVEIIQRLQEKINTSSTLCPHLKEYPFPLSRIKVSIHFHKREKNYLAYYEDGSVAFVKEQNDHIYYFTELPEINGRQPLQPVPMAKESYEDAKKRVTGKPKKRFFF